MTQLLGTMHQNYHDLAQQELARIHRINEQILQIQQRLTEVDSSLEPASTSEDQTVAPEVETHHRLLPVPFGGESPDPTSEKEDSQDVETVPIPGTTPEVVQETPTLPESEQSQTASAGACEGVGVEAPLPCDKKGVDDANQQTDESNTDEELKTVEELETDKELETNHTLGNDAEVPTENPRKKRSATRDVDSHGYLIERLALLERERNSRWKKVMRLLTGSGP
ncbi:MAG: hypothetical protein IID46_15205 [Planctomycetes bacterium]|nr:hypothetical protein [Planctomycetota bacterium]